MVDMVEVSHQYLSEIYIDQILPSSYSNMVTSINSGPIPR